MTPEQETERRLAIQSAREVAYLLAEEAKTPGTPAWHRQRAHEAAQAQAARATEAQRQSAREAHTRAWADLSGGLDVPTIGGESKQTLTTTPRSVDDDLADLFSHFGV